MLHKIHNNTFCKLFASRQIQQYWWKNLGRWSVSQSLSLCLSVLTAHVERGFPLAVVRLHSVRLLPFRTAHGPYLPFALSTSVPFS